MAALLATPASSMLMVHLAGAGLAFMGDGTNFNNNNHAYDPGGDRLNNKVEGTTMHDDNSNININ